MKISNREFFLALAVGILIGWFAACGAVHYRMHWMNHGKMLDRVSRELKLSPDQREKMGKILEDTRGKMMALRNENKPRFRSIRSEAEVEIKAFLNADQQQKFDQLEAKWEAERQKRRSKWSD